MTRTRQEIFDLAWNGLKAQGFERARHKIGGCAYRDEAGRRCAIGHCIPDDAYEDELEGPIGRDVLDAANISQADLEFCRNLQRRHDYADGPKDMADGLIQFARDNALTIPS